MSDTNKHRRYTSRQHRVLGAEELDIAWQAALKTGSFAQPMPWAELAQAPSPVKRSHTRTQKHKRRSQHAAQSMSVAIEPRQPSAARLAASLPKASAQQEADISLPDIEVE